jgi:hypothetical protein
MLPDTTPATPRGHDKNLVDTLTDSAGLGFSRTCYPSLILGQGVEVQCQGLCHGLQAALVLNHGPCLAEGVGSLLAANLRAPQDLQQQNDRIQHNKYGDMTSAVVDTYNKQLFAMWQRYASRDGEQVHVAWSAECSSASACMTHTTRKFVPRRLRLR